MKAKVLRLLLKKFKIIQGMFGLHKDFKYSKMKKVKLNE